VLVMSRNPFIQTTKRESEITQFVDFSSYIIGIIDEFRKKVQKFMKYKRRKYELKKLKTKNERKS
jgi:hypothetical protein